MRRTRACAVALVTALAAILPITTQHAHAALVPSTIIQDVADYGPDAAVDFIAYGAGAVYQHDYERLTISRRDGNSVTVVAGGGNSTGEGIPATSAIIEPSDFVVAPDGSIYFADITRNQVRKVSPDGIVSTVAGNGNGVASGDGGSALSAGMTPRSVAVDAAGNLLIADGGGTIFPSTTIGNHRLRKVTPGGTISTLAVFDLWEDDLNVIPSTVRVHAAGNAYTQVLVPVSGVDPVYQIVKVTPGGAKSFVGEPDGQGMRTMDVAPDGTVFITWLSMFAAKLWSIAPDGTETVLNETAYLGQDLDYTNEPVSEAMVLASSIAVTPQGDLYVSDGGHLRLLAESDPEPAAESVQPARILDTRPGDEQTGYTGDKPAAGQTVTFQVAGKGGVPEHGAAAVTMNVVITEATSAGFVTAWPSGLTRPLASSLNAKGPGDTVANLVTVPVGADGKVSLYTQSGGHLIADVSGWLPAGTYVPKTPTRILDTRPGDEQVGYTGDKPGAQAVVDLQVTGVAGVPNGISAVTLNVTATEATAPGFVTIWPQGETRPLASSLNLDAVGATAPNQVTVPVGATGKVSIYTQNGTHLVADLVGYYNQSTGYTPLTPARILDTRPGDEQVGYTGDKPAALQTVKVDVAGKGGVPATGVGSVILNVTATEATAAGFVTAWPTGIDRPLASILNLNYPGETRPNAVVVPLGADGAINLYTQSGTHLIVDVSGWFPG